MSSQNSIEELLSVLEAAEKQSDTEQICLATQRLGWLHTLRGNYQETEQYFLKAWDCISSVQNQSVELLAQGLRPLAHHYLTQGNLDKAESTLSNLLALYEKSDANPNYQAAYCLVLLAMLNSLQNQPTESQQYSERAAQIIRNRCASGYAVDYLSLAEIITIYLNQERMFEARETAIASLLENEDSAWAGNPVAAKALTYLAEAFRAQGKFKQAESVYKRAMAIKINNGDESAPDFATLAFNLGNMYLSLKKYADAEPILKTAMKARVRSFGVEHPAVASCIETYVALLKKTKRTSLANKLDLRAREIRSRYVAKVERQA